MKPLLRDHASVEELVSLKAALDEHSIVAITDPRGLITYVNDKFCAISKYSREELLGRDHRIINSGHHPKEFMRELWAALAQGRIWKGEIRNRAKDGAFYWVDTTIMPSLNAAGKPYQYVSIRTDITRRKNAEAEIQRFNDELASRVQARTAELEASNRELEAFSYSVSHDLRGPIRHISGFLGLLRRAAGPALSAEQSQHLQKIGEAARQMGDLIDDLLQFSRIGRTQMLKSRVSLDRLVEDALSALQPEIEGRNIAWKRAALPEAEADPALLRQVLVNLLSNALKYSRPRARAEIEIGWARESESEFALYVRDNGVGFDMKYAAKLFGVFQRLHSADEFEGTGIGLANVRRIVARHGGRTWAEGEVDRGATFYFSLPSPAPVAGGAPSAGLEGNTLNTVAEILESGEWR
jgi:PAS domain S-box-containing protein